MPHTKFYNSDHKTMKLKQWANQDIALGYVMEMKVTSSKFIYNLAIRRILTGWNPLYGLSLLLCLFPLDHIDLNKQYFD